MVIVKNFRFSSKHGPKNILLLVKSIFKIRNISLINITYIEHKIKIMIINKVIYKSKK